MSTMTQGIDAQEFLVGWLKGVTGMYVADINAIPEDKWTATFGGCTRPASVQTADAVALLLWTTEALNGNILGGGEEGMMEELTKACGTKESSIATLTSASEKLGAALTGANVETLSKVVTAPWGMDAPLYMIAQIAVSHIWYHDGQLNFIQSLLGDGKVHWMGD